MAGRGYRNTSQYGGPNDSKSDPRFGNNYDQQQQHGQQHDQSARGRGSLCGKSPPLRAGELDPPVLTISPLLVFGICHLARAAISFPISRKLVRC